MPGASHMFQNILLDVLLLQARGGSLWGPRPLLLVPQSGAEQSPVSSFMWGPAGHLEVLPWRLQSGSTHSESGGMLGGS